MSELKLQMTAAEIVWHYRQAKDKANDIKVLMDLNVCEQSVIRDILTAAGETLPPALRGRAAHAPKQKEKQETPKRVAAPDAPTGTAAPAITETVYQRIETILSAIRPEDAPSAKRFAVELCTDLMREHAIQRLGVDGESGNRGRDEMCQ